MHMICNECGSQLPEGDVFCNQCGKEIKPIDDKSATDSSSLSADNDTQEKKGVSWLNGCLIAACGLVAIIAFGAFLGSRIDDDQKSEPQENRRQQEENRRQQETIPSMKHGYSISERQNIFYELVEAEDAATKRAEDRYPGFSAEEVQKKIALMDELMAEEHIKIAKKYGLSKEQLIDISNEGVLNDWPMPHL